MYAIDRIRVVIRLSYNRLTNLTIANLLEYSDIADPQQINGLPIIQIYCLTIRLTGLADRIIQYGNNLQKDN